MLDLNTTDCIHPHLRKYNNGNLIICVKLDYHHEECEPKNIKEVSISNLIKWKNLLKSTLKEVNTDHEIDIQMLLTIIDKEIKKR